MELRDVLDYAQARREQLITQRAAIESQIAQVDEMLRGLVLAAEAFGADVGTVACTESDVFPASDFKTMTRTAAIERVLAEAGASMSPAQVRDALHCVGRTDSYAKVSAALAHLQRRGRAHAELRGHWRAGPAPLQPRIVMFEERAASSNGNGSAATQDSDSNGQGPLLKATVG